jgi:hypothetical protein
METKEKINNLMEILQDKKGITAEIVGSWLWVYGDTYAIKEELKTMGFSWSKGKKKWYFTEQKSEHKPRYKQNDYITIKNNYGYQTLQEA